MRRTVLLLMLGLLSTTLSIAAISVYVFHDVDKDKIGHLNQAFAGMCIESVVFTLIVGGGVALFTLAGRLLFRLKGYSPRAKLGLLLGIGVTVFQYPWEFAARKELPKLADSALSFYLVLAVVFCAIIIVRDSYKQMALPKSHADPLDS